MDTLRENIRKALCELVGRKDAAIFQSADTFEKMLQKIGNWQQLPEILALKTGLQERVPWELQKGSSGPVSRSLINSLASIIGRKHQIEPSLAVWAIESWAISLGLKIEPELAKPPVKPTAVSAPIKAPLSAVAGQADFSADTQARAGIIFGTDASGLIRVFKAWWQPAPESETAGLVAVQVKNEKTGGALFAAAPPRKKTATISLPPKTTSHVQSSAKIVPAAKPVAAPARPVSVKPAAAPPVSQAPVVYTGSADELCAQAQALLPGFGTRVNIPEALQILQQAVKLGSVSARRMIGEIYHKGLGVKQDFRIASVWFKQAADSGDAASQFYLGTLYQCGMGVEFDLARARAWLQKAAGQGHKEAQVLLNEISQA